jgi:hypothetical protein
VSVAGDKALARLEPLLRSIMEKAGIAGYRIELVAKKKLPGGAEFDTESRWQSQTHFLVRFDPDQVEKEDDDQLIELLYHELTHVKVWRMVERMKRIVKPYLPEGRYKEVVDEIVELEEDYAYSTQQVGLALMGRPITTITTREE